jgi:hypothetical protein
MTKDYNTFTQLIMRICREENRDSVSMYIRTFLNILINIWYEFACILKYIIFNYFGMIFVMMFQFVGYYY